MQYEEDSDDGGGFAYGEDNDNDNDNEGGVNDDLVGAAFGAKERTKHGDYSAFEHPLERRANELKQNDCKVRCLLLVASRYELGGGDGEVVLVFMFQHACVVAPGCR